MKGPWVLVTEAVRVNISLTYIEKKCRYYKKIRINYHSTTKKMEKLLRAHLNSMRTRRDLITAA